MNVSQNDASIWQRYRAMSLWKKILFAMLLGCVVGVALHGAGQDQIVEYTRQIGGVFITAIMMMVVPLVFVSIVCGIGTFADGASIGRVGGKVIGFYLVTTFIAVWIGLGFGHLFQPGAGIDLSHTATVDIGEVPSILQKLISIVPSNPVSAAANGEVLQIIFFAVILGLAIKLVGKEAKIVRDFFVSLNAVILKTVEMVLVFAPYGVFALMVGTAGTFGLDLILPLAMLVVAAYTASIVHSVVVYGGLVTFLARLNPIRFFKGILSAQLFAFGCSSSAATLPITKRCTEKELGVKPSLTSFSLPVGVTFNMDGGAIYIGVLVMFIAQAYGITLSMQDYLMVMVTASLVSIGIAGVPGTVAVMIAIVLQPIGLPMEAIAIVLGVDRILDMARTVVNVTGDAACTVVVAKSEDAIDLDVYNRTELHTAVDTGGDGQDVKDIPDAPQKVRTLTEVA